MAAANEHPITDPGQLHLGSVYSKALLDAAEQAGQAERVLAELDSLVDDVLDRLPQLDGALKSPRLGPDDKQQLIDRAFGGRADALLVNFLKVLARHQRLDALRAIRQAAHQLYNERHGQVDVLVQTAQPLDGPLREQVVRRLEAALGRRVQATLEVDPELLGGIVVRVGDTVYDGSVLNRLRRMREETFVKTVQEMRGTLDRFFTGGELFGRGEGG